MFNKSTSLGSQTKKVIAETNHGVSYRIKLVTESLLAQSSSSEVEGCKKINQDNNIDAPMQQILYRIAPNREKRVIDQPKRFVNIVDKNLLGYRNYVKFSLLVVETVDVIDPNSYEESISILEVCRCVGNVGKKIESLHKNQTWKFSSWLRGQTGSRLQRGCWCEQSVYI